MQAQKAELTKKFETALNQPSHVSKIQIGRDISVTITQSLVAKVVNVEVSVPPDVPVSVSEA
jgi:hypothetical protein